MLAPEQFQDFLHDGNAAIAGERVAAPNTAGRSAM